MIREERRQEIHRLRAVERWKDSRIARELDLDQKTVRLQLSVQSHNLWQAVAPARAP